MTAVIITLVFWAACVGLVMYMGTNKGRRERKAEREIRGGE